MRRYLAAACLLSLTLALSMSGTAQAPPSADAYVTTIQPGANFGSSALLPVQVGTTSFIQFNLGGFPASSTIAKATLRLYVNAVAAPGSFDVYQVSQTWSERGITLNTAPPFGSSATGNLPVSVTAASQNQFILIDITQLVQAWTSGSSPNNGVALALTTATGSFSFDSKESTGTGHQPELEVVFGSAAESQVLSGASSTVAGATSKALVQGLSDPYVDNGTGLQVGANFNIDGNGSAATFNATSQYFLAGVPVFGSNGTSSLFVGPGAGQSNTGLQNTFLGVSSGQFNSTGSYLTFLGTNSGLSNTTGSNNSFIGANSGNSNTTGSYNSFLGTGSGKSNTTGSYLTFLGMRAGLSNTTGNYNSFAGTYSGYSNTTGDYLTFLGMQSGYMNSTGTSNSFVGANSGYSNTIGSYNSFLGTGSGKSNGTGNFLIFLGARAGFSNTTGSNNSFIGTYSGLNNITGSFNTFIGYNSGLNADPAASNNVYISSLGAPVEGGTIRIGDPANQTATYIAGIYGNAPSSALPVVVNANGQLGTTTASIGVTTFNGRTGAVVPAANDYSFSQLSGTVNDSQFAGTYTNPVVLSNPGNAIAGTFTGNGSGLTGIGSGLNWPVVTKSADYPVQLSDFATPTNRGNYLVLTGPVSHTFTLPNPPPPNGYCVAIGNVADPGINSGANAFLTVQPNGLLLDNSVTKATMPRRTAFLFCSDGSAGYYRLGYQQNGVSEIGPFLETLDTGTVNVMKTTFRNGLDFGLVDGSFIFIRPSFANTSGTVTLNLNGFGASKVLKYGVQPLAPGDLNPNTYAVLIYLQNGSYWELVNPLTAQLLTGTTASLGGSSISGGTCLPATVGVTGATVGHPVAVSASDGSLPDGLIILSAAVTATNTVSVQLCAVATVTPAAKTYNVSTQ